MLWPILGLVGVRSSLVTTAVETHSLEPVRHDVVLDLGVEEFNVHMQHKHRYSSSPKILRSTGTSLRIEWNLSITDTLGNTWSALIKEVSLFQRLLCTLPYVAWTIGNVLIREVSLFRRFLIEVPL